MLHFYKRIALIGVLSWIIAIPYSQAQKKAFYNPAKSLRNYFTGAEQSHEPAKLIQLYTGLKNNNNNLPSIAATSWWLEHHESYIINLSTGLLEISSQTFYSYDSNDRTSEELTQTPDPSNPGSWIHSTYLANTYDANGNMTEALNQIWNNNTWENYFRVQLTYVNNLETGRVHQDWDTQNGWFNTYQLLSTYDSQGNLTEEVEQSYDLANGQWNNEYRYTYTYSNGYIITEEDQEWVNGQWRNQTLYKVNYNIQNNIAEVIEQEFDTVQSKYINAYRDRYLYYQISLKDSAFVTSEWDTTNNVWTEDSQILFYYDSNGNDTKWLYQDWNDTNKAYEDSGQQLFTYDTNMNLTQSTLQLWLNSAWVSHIQLKYFHSITRPTAVPLPIDEDISEIPRQIQLNQNYPNPFNPSTQINYQLNTSMNVKLAIYDIIGREVETLVNKKQSSGSYTVTFNASNLSSGIYFYRLVTDNVTITKKMILIK